MFFSVRAGAQHEVEEQKQNIVADISFQSTLLYGHGSTATNIIFVSGMFAWHVVILIPRQQYRGTDN